MDQRSNLVDQLTISGSDRVSTESHTLAWSLAGGGVLAAAALAGWLWYADADVPLIAVATAEAVNPGSTPLRGSSLDASGYVVARRQATVSSKVTGKVVEVLIEEGQEVQRDEIVARLDDTNARAAVAQAEAQLAQSEANLLAAKVAYENDQAQFSRNESQFEAGFISAQNFDSAKASHDATYMSLQVAARAVDVAEANLAIANRSLDDTTVRAPFSGVVTVKAAQEGEMVSPVSAGGGFTRTGIGTIVDMESLEVEVDVSENFINRVRPNQDVQVRLNAYPDWVIPAHVVAIIPTADRAKATVRVRVGFEVTDERILPQMGVRVAFLAEELPDLPDQPALSGVVVPPAAVTASGDTGVVYLVSGDRLERRAVRLGPLTPAGQVVLSGLMPGVKLATGELSEFSDGLRVRVESL